MDLNVTTGVRLCAILYYTRIGFSTSFVVSRSRARSPFSFCITLFYFIEFSFRCKFFVFRWYILRNWITYRWNHFVATQRAHTWSTVFSVLDVRTTATAMAVVTDKSVCYVHISTNSIDIMLFASAKIYTIHFMADYGAVPVDMEDGYISCTTCQKFAAMLFSLSAFILSASASTYNIIYIRAG